VVLRAWNRSWPWRISIADWISALRHLKDFKSTRGPQTVFLIPIQNVRSRSAPSWSFFSIRADSTSFASASQTQVAPVPLLVGGERDTSTSTSGASTSSVLSTSLSSAFTSAGHGGIWDYKTITTPIGPMQGGSGPSTASTVDTSLQRRRL
jgi:hypothetical protein